MLNDRIKKKLKSIKLTYQNHDKSYETKLIIYIKKSQ